MLEWKSYCSLLLLLSYIQLLAGISTCSSNVHVNEDLKSFHTDFYDTLDADLLSFCVSNYISDFECNKVKAFHIKNCFNNRYTSTLEIPKSDNLNQLNEKIEDNTGLVFVKKNIGKIDFSMKVGPILEVHTNSQKYYLQSFLNESPEESVIRFCGMLNLDNNHNNCRIIKNNFLKLFDENSRTSCS